MGPHATLADSTLAVRENIMNSIMIHFFGCRCCVTCNRHNELVQVAAFASSLANFKLYELNFSGPGSTSSVDSNLVGISAKGKSRHTDGQVWGTSSFQKELPSTCIVDPNAVSHSGAGACGESFLNPNCRDQICREDEN